jgi:hypothetical protein
MRSRALLFGMALSVLFCLGTGLLWTRSFFYDDSYLGPGTHYHLGFESRQGNVSIDLLINFPQMGRNSGWNSHAANGRFAKFTLQSLINFNYRNIVIPAGAFGGTIRGNARIISVNIPTWPLFVPWTLFLAWGFFRGRKKTRWGFRSDVAWINPALPARVVRFSIFSTTGVAVGALAGYVAIQFDLGRTQWVWIAGFLILLPMVCVLIILSRRRIPWHRAILWMSLEVAGSVCFFEATVERFWYYFFLDLPDERNRIILLLSLGITCFICGAVLLLVFQVKPEVVKPGPYCPACGYCLIGSPRQVCSECGRAFTYDELGVGAEALMPVTAKSV